MPPVTDVRAVDRAVAGGALRRVPTQDRAREKVDRALEAAQALLEREGLAAVTLTRVAAEAGVSVGALYQYLPDREAIVATLSTLYHARHEVLMDDLVAQLSAERSEDPVGSVVAALAGLYRAQPGTRALRTGLQGASQLSLIREHKERMVAKVHALLAAYELVRAEDPDRVARTAFFAADGIMHEAFVLDDAGDAALLDQLEVLLRAYLGAS